MEKESTQKAWEDMTIDELRIALESLEEEYGTYENEWQNEFTRQEIKAINIMIKEREEQNKWRD